MSSKDTAHLPESAVPRHLTPAERRWINWRLRRGPAMTRDERGEYLMKLLERLKEINGGTQ